MNEVWPPRAWGMWWSVWSISIGTRQTRTVHIGVAHHLGWAVVVTAAADHSVVDRRRIELVEDGLPNAPIHHEGGAHELYRSGEPLDDGELSALVDRVRVSAVRMTAAALTEIEEAVPPPIESISLRAWPADFPTEIAEQRRVPHESSADSIMYRQVIAEVAAARGWQVYLYDKTVEAQAADRLGVRAQEVLVGPRKILGPPWNKDHRTALAAAVMAS